MATIHAEKFILPTHERHCVTSNLLYGHDLISIKDLNREQIEQVLHVALSIKQREITPLLTNKLIAHCFFEPSTRTRLSFETATLRLGGNVIGFSSDDHLSTKKGETLHDTIRVLSDYADLLIIRHEKEGAARLAAEVSPKPVINAGDGANQHPTQALIDLFTINQSQQRLDGLSIGLVGDLKFGRTIHSFADLCTLFDMRLFLVAPDALTLPDSVCDRLKKRGVRFSFHQSIEEVIPKVDILYMTRIQQERLINIGVPLLDKQFILTPQVLQFAKPNLKVLHPLPRINEIDIRVDKTPHADYFQQANNGVHIRQALLTLLLNETLP